MSKIVVISGSNGVGKDTFVKYIKELYPFGQIINVSTVDKVKTAARELGWDGNKDEKGREFLSELKFFASQYYPITINTVREAMAANQRASCIFVHCREVEEIEKIKEDFDAITIIVRNEVKEQNIANNRADKQVFDYQYDYEIDNNGTLDDLRKVAVKFINEVLI